MGNNNFLAQIVPPWRIIAAVITSFLFLSCGNNDQKKPLKLAISPYQDLAMIENIEHLGLEKKHGVDVELITLPWEEIIPSIGSAGETVDIGFASYIEYLTKANNLNKNTDDSILFIYPAYVFAGGGFTTLKNDFPTFDEKNINDTSLIKRFLSYRIGAQKNSMFDMAIYQLANRANVDIRDIQVTDVPMADGVFALRSGSLDFAAAGLTQRNEIEQQGGKVVLSFNTLGFADITGFICKKSVYEKRKSEINELIKMWFECVDFVLSDVDNNAKIATLPYLDKNASTHYTVETYKEAISQEIFPRSIEESQKLILSNSAHFSAANIYYTVSEYLVTNKIVLTPPAKPKFITIN